MTNNTPPDGRQGVSLMGHRSFVGGNGEYWDSIGKLQFNFLISNGLKSQDILLDIACGALRGGVHYIPYLEGGNYLGFDKTIDLIILGVSCELGAERFMEKRPLFAVSDKFDFSSFGKKPTHAIAQSLFTHLTREDICLCLANLRAFAGVGCTFYATFFEVDDKFANPEQSHSLAMFYYSRGEMEAFGADTGWRSEYIGDWNHPRRQMMMRYTAI